jgi:small subunit ribosomal protein S6
MQAEWDASCYANGKPKTMNQYEALYILDIQGKEEGVKEMIDQIEKEIRAQGGKLTGTQKMDRRKFESVAGHLDAGYYLGINFQLDPAKVTPLQQKLKLNDKVYRQFYLRAQKETAAA